MSLKTLKNEEKTVERRRENKGKEVKRNNIEVLHDFYGLTGWNQQQTLDVILFQKGMKDLDSLSEKTWLARTVQDTSVFGRQIIENLNMPIKISVQCKRKYQ
jgi:hypothetical protein